MTHWLTLLARVWGQDPNGDLVLGGSGSYQWNGGHCADGVSIQRGLSSSGWDIDSNTKYVMFVFLFQEIVSKAQS